MVTPELLNFILQQQKKNILKENIISKLRAVGWHEGDILEGFERTETTAPARPVVTSQPVITQPIVSQVITSQPVEIKAAPVVAMPTPQVKVAQAVPEKLVVPESFIPKASVAPVSPSPIPASTPAPTSAPVLASMPQPISTPVATPVSGAMMSMYQKGAVAPVGVKGATVPPVQTGGKGKWVVLVVILLLLAGAAAASVLGYIKLPYVNMTLIKPDPKAVLLGAGSAISQASSYKTETDITLTSPLFSDISASLLSGEVVDSRTKESVSLNIKSSTGTDNTRNEAYEYSAVMRGSIFKDDIMARVVHRGTTSFVTTPDLRHFLGQNFPAPTTVAVADGEFASLLPVVRENIANIIRKYDTYNVLSGGIPPLVSGKFTQSTQDFISGLTFISKEDHVVSGVPMYHYQAEASNQVTAKLLSEVSDLLFVVLPATDRSRLTDALSTLHIDSIDFWVSKDTPHVYQYKMRMTMPLSKAIGLSDTGLSGSVLTFDWQTRVYDLGVPNTITVPAVSVPMPDYVKSITDMKIKNVAGALPLAAQSFRNATLNFGKASNLSGSCSVPVARSLFSPTGHSAGASIAVGDIATAISTVIKLTGENSLCYSTPSAWAVALPLASDPAKYYCVDSKGTVVNLSTKITSPECK
jgi:hypothetical protein